MTTFTAQLKAFQDKAGARSDLVARQVAMDILRGVVFNTPVDIGHARANWQVQIGAVPTGTVEAPDPTGLATFGKGQAIALTWKAGDGSLFIANNLPYIERLEDGWSQQAPAGMVRLTLMRFRDFVDRAAGDAVRELP